MAFDKIFWDKYQKAFRKTSKKDTNRFEQIILKYPIGSAIIIIFLLFLSTIGIWNAITYVPPPPMPTMNIYGFIDAFLSMQVAWPIWVIIFLFFWLTKW